MKLTDVDKNFEIKKSSNSEFIVKKFPIKGVKLFGVLYDETSGFHRIDVETSKKINPGVEYLNFQTAGGRLTFSTNSKKLYFCIEYFRMEYSPHHALTGSAGLVLSKIVNGKFQYRGTIFPSFTETTIESTFTVSNNNSFNNYVLYMPLYIRVKSIYIGVDKGSSIKEAEIYNQNLKPILYYGSSITQGGCSSRPDNSYQCFVSEKFNVDFINLGFSGSAYGEEEISKYLSSIDASIFVLDYDHNSANSKTLAETHSKIYKQYRKSHPNTPIIVISKPDYYYAQSDIRENKRRKEVILSTYNDAIKNGDKNIYFIDGSRIYPKEIREHCSVDGCHPTDLGFYYFAKAIIKVISKNKLL